MKSRVNQKWTLVELIKVAKKFKTRSQFKVHHQSAYHSTRKQKLTSQVFAHMIDGNKKRAYTKEEIIKIAKAVNTRNAFKIKSRGAYDAARRMGILKLACKHMPTFANQNRFEESILHPKVKRILNKMKILYEHEAFLSPKAKPDFLLYNKHNQVMVIEIKADRSKHEKLEVKAQIKKYNIEAQNKFKSKFIKTLLVSEKGTYGINFEQFKIELKKFLK